MGGCAASVTLRCAERLSDAPQSDSRESCRKGDVKRSAAPISGPVVGGPEPPHPNHLVDALLSMHAPLREAYPSALLCPNTAS